MLLLVSPAIRYKSERIIMVTFVRFSVCSWNAISSLQASCLVYVMGQPDVIIMITIVSMQCMCKLDQS